MQEGTELNRYSADEFVLNLAFVAEGIEATDLFAQVQANCPIDKVTKFRSDGSDLAMSVCRKLKNLKSIVLTEPTLSSLATVAAQMSLEHLELFWPPEGMDFSQLKTLKKLRHLEIVPSIHSYSSEKHHTTIDIANIKVLEALVRLSLTGLKIANAAALQSLPALRELNISASEIENLGFVMTALPKLESLCMSRIDKFEFVESLRSLKTLKVFGSAAESADFLKGLVLLECLELCNSKIKNFDFLTTLKQLRWLDLSHTRIDDLSPLVDCKELRRLLIANTKVKDLNPIQNCTKLESLHIERTLIEKLHPLLNTSLKDLWLTEANVDNDSIRMVKKAFPDIEMANWN